MKRSPLKHAAFPSAPKAAPKLRAIQKLMAAAVMRPLAGNDMQPRWTDGRRMSAVAASFIKPNDRVDSFERLEIYNRQYWYRVLECFYDDFPGLRAVVGERRFTQLAEAYLARHPSRSFTLRNLGQDLLAFLQKNPRWTRPHTALAADAVRLEWAHIEAFDLPEYPKLKQEDLKGAGAATFRLNLQPHVRLLELRYPIDDFLIHAKRRSEDSHAEAPNAASKRRAPRKAARPPRRPKPRRTHLVAYRLHNSVYYKRVEPRAFALLCALHKGIPLQKALAAATPKRSDPAWPETIRQWFSLWMSVGWFCRPEAVAAS